LVLPQDPNKLGQVEAPQEKTFFKIMIHDTCVR
jgi:hypothetical protein